MKNYLSTLFLIANLLLGAAQAGTYDDVVKSPTSFFREIAKVILQTPITWDDPADGARSSMDYLNQA